jgi:hypothetical protein
LTTSQTPRSSDSCRQRRRHIVVIVVVTVVVIVIVDVVDRRRRRRTAENVVGDVVSQTRSSRFVPYAMGDAFEGVVLIPLTVVSRTQKRCVRHAKVMMSPSSLFHSKKAKNDIMMIRT